MYTDYQNHLKTVIGEIREAGLYKEERIIVSPQGAEITLNTGQKVLNFCANNYLGLSNNAKLVEAAKKALDDHGYGISSVRFICGTTDLHKELERKIASFFHTEDTILYAACFEVFLNHCLPKRMQSSPTLSIMLRSSTAYVFVRLRDTDMPMPIPLISRNNLSWHRNSASGLL